MIVLLAAGYRIHARRRRTGSGRRGGAANSMLAAESIVDPSGYSWEVILEALALEPEEEDPAPQAQPRGDAYYASLLGLEASLRGGEQGTIRPNLLWGSRPLGQVFIRSGADERAEARQIATDRHWRDITVLRVEAPNFELWSEHGVLVPSEMTPSPVRELISWLRPDETLWQRSLIVAGPAGIVASRPSLGPVTGGWVYDLWLCERMAQVLRLKSLPSAQLGTRWRIPYGLGRRLTPSPLAA